MCRLLQRQCVAGALGVPFAEVTIQRTRGRKPFYAGQAQDPRAPNFNFNVSHEVPQSAAHDLRLAMATACQNRSRQRTCHLMEVDSQTHRVPITTGGLRGVGGGASLHLRRGRGSTAAGPTLAAGAIGGVLCPLRAAVHSRRGVVPTTVRNSANLLGHSRGPAAEGTST